MRVYYATDSNNVESVSDMNKTNFVHPRDQIVDIMQRIYGYGMTTTSGGNLSILDSDGNMWISPASVDKGTLRREDIVCVKPDGTVEGRHKPSSEFPFHRAIYKMRPDIKGILHAHPPALVSFSVAGKIPDTSVHPAAKMICGTVGYAPYEVPGSEALGKNVAAAFSAGHSTILLENHGACTAGATLQEAFKRFETLDFCARLILRASQLGTPHYLSDTEIEFSQLDRNIDFRPFDPEVRSSDEMELRYQMALLIRRAYKQMLFTSTEGTFAVRVDKERILITPRNVDRRQHPAGGHGAGQGHALRVRPQAEPRRVAVPRDFRRAARNQLPDHRESAAPDGLYRRARGVRSAGHSRKLHPAARDACLPVRHAVPRPQEDHRHDLAALSGHHARKRLHDLERPHAA